MHETKNPASVLNERDIFNGMMECWLRADEIRI